LFEGCECILNKFVWRRWVVVIFDCGLKSEMESEKKNRYYLFCVSVGLQGELGTFEYPSIRIRNRIPFSKKKIYIRIPITLCEIVFDHRLQYFFLHVRIK
jgi:hypothetical protein